MTDAVSEPAAFPDRWIRPRSARMSASNPSVADCPPGSTSWDIEVTLAPFDVSEALSDGDDWTRENGTAFRFDFICLPILRAGDLGGRSFEFPVNPAPGYVDGSIYLMDSHNPADLRTVAFGPVEGALVSARFVVDVGFEFEQSGFRDRRVEFTADVLLPDDLIVLGD